MTLVLHATRGDAIVMWMNFSRLLRSNVAAEDVAALPLALLELGGQKRERNSSLQMRTRHACGAPIGEGFSLRGGEDEGDGKRLALSLNSKPQTTSRNSQKLCLKSRFFPEESTPSPAKHRRRCAGRCAGGISDRQQTSVTVESKSRQPGKNSRPPLFPLCYTPLYLACRTFSYVQREGFDWTKAAMIVRWLSGLQGK